MPLLKCGTRNDEREMKKFGTWKLQFIVHHFAFIVLFSLW